MAMALGGKKLYSISESYWIFYQGTRTVKYMSRARKNKVLSAEFIERIMLAVTQVNGCPACSYAHTNIALDVGMSDVEIRNMLAGVLDDVPADEISAIMFAQHYADRRGHPSKESWERIVELYGISRAKGILGAIRAIMIGNAYGIPGGSFFNRFRGKPDKRSNLLYELSMLITSIVFTPIALIHAVVSDLSKIPIISFEV